APLKRELRVPLACSLAGEDLFLEQLQDPHYSHAISLMREQAKHVDCFVAYNQYFKEFMVDYLDLAPARVEVMRHGLQLQGHGRRPGYRAAQPVTVAYFAGSAPEKGLHTLIEAFSNLCADPALPPIRLRVAGYKSSGDEAYWQANCSRIEELK